MLGYIYKKGQTQFLWTGCSNYFWVDAKYRQEAVVWSALERERRSTIEEMTRKKSMKSQEMW